MPKTRRLLSVVIREATEWAQTQGMKRGSVSVLLISHDSWCSSKKSRSHNWCNCEVEFSIGGPVTPKVIMEICAEERQRQGLNQARDN